MPLRRCRGQEEPSARPHRRQAALRGPPPARTSSASRPAAPRRRTRPRSCGEQGWRNSSARQATVSERSPATRAQRRAMGELLNGGPARARARSGLQARQTGQVRMVRQRYGSGMVAGPRAAPRGGDSGRRGPPCQDAAHNERLLQADEQAAHAGRARLCAESMARSQDRIDERRAGSG
jgi:hypothetical protein